MRSRATSSDGAHVSAIAGRFVGRKAVQPHEPGIAAAVIVTHKNDILNFDHRDISTQVVRPLPNALPQVGTSMHAPRYFSTAFAEATCYTATATVEHMRAESNTRETHATCEEFAHLRALVGPWEGPARGCANVKAARR